MSFHARRHAPPTRRSGAVLAHLLVAQYGALLLYLWVSFGPNSGCTPSDSKVSRCRRLESERTADGVLITKVWEKACGFTRTVVEGVAVDDVDESIVVSVRPNARSESRSVMQPSLIGGPFDELDREDEADREGDGVESVVDEPVGVAAELTEI